MRQELHHDITANRHGGSETSIAANPAVVTKREMHEQILDAARKNGGRTWLKHAVRATGIPVNTMSGRLTELRVDLRLLRKTGTKEEGCSVLEIVEQKEFVGGLF